MALLRAASILPMMDPGGPGREQPAPGWEQGAGSRPGRAGWPPLPPSQPGTGRSLPGPPGSIAGRREAAAVVPAWESRRAKRPLFHVALERRISGAKEAAPVEAAVAAAQRAHREASQAVVPQSLPRQAILLKKAQVHIKFTGMERCKINETANNSECGSAAMPMECYMVLEDTKQKTLIAVLCCVTGGLCILENSLVLYLIVSSPKIRNKPSYLFISSLALADTLASIIFVSSFVSFHVFKRTNFSKEIFLLQLGGVTTCFTASLGSLLLMAFDRYICILKPSEYKVLVTSRRALVALGVMWLTIVFTAALPLLGWNCCSLNSVCSALFPFVDNKYLSSWIALVVILLVSIVYAYMHVLWKSRKHALYMEKHHSQTGQQNSRMRIDIKLAKTLVIVLVVLVVCWSPVLALMTYSVFAPLDNFFRKVFAFCSTLCLVNSMVNPAIYALRSRELYSSLRKVCLCFRKMAGASDSNPDPESTQKSCPIENICDEIVGSTDTELMKV